MSLDLAYGWSGGVLLRFTRFLLLVVALFLGVLVLFFTLQTAAAQTSEENLRPLIQALAEGSFDDKAEAIKTLAATGEPAAARILEVMREGDLYQRKSDDLVVITKKQKRERIQFEPILGEELETARSRTVTQNRQMASSMGIRTSWVDAMTFGLGSGVAGIAGVALSQIDNVSPNLGQGYIIDSFMVVVFGGVGNLWGTLVGAMTLGVANKFLEPYAGAVLAKIFVLVFIILFIQKRPRGLLALKGRAVEA